MFERRISRVMLAAVLTVVLVLSASGCDSFFNQQEDEPAGTDEIISVETEVSRVEDMAITKEYSGKIRPVSDIMIIPKMPGRVEKVHVKVGQQVQKGDVLIELDGTEVELQVAQAQAAYRASKISVDSTKEKAQDLKADKKELSDSIKTIDEGIKEIDQGLGQVTKSMEELGQALQQGVITEKQYNASLEELNTNKAGLEEQRKGLTAQRAELAAMEKSLEGTIQSLPSDEQLDAQLEQAKAGLDLAKSAQDSLKLTSPIDGTVATLSVEEGEMASQAVPPVTVIDMSSLLLDVSVMEGDIMGIEEGQNMDVFIDALGTQPVTGIVHTVSPVP
ncbi:MAG: efflux RND transporter periplasmic adaptor subunit, partial [Mahellales bacterium]